MCACVTYIAYITQVTLFIYDRWLCFFHIQFFFNFSAGKHRAGWMVVFTFRLSFLSCSFTVSAEIWPLNGKTIRTLSSVSLACDKGRCWSQTFESTTFLMVELTRCLGYFKHENAVFNWLHSSERCEQQEDKLYARSSIVLSKPCLYRWSTWLWQCKRELNMWVLRTLLSLFEAIDSVTGCPEMGACHCVRFPSWILQRNVPF